MWIARNLNMWCAVVGVALCVFLPCSVRADAPKAKVTVSISKEVKDLVPVIKTHESLFHDTELTYTYDYKYLGNDKSDYIVKNASANAHQIRQGKLYWLRYDHKGKAQSGKDVDQSSLIGCDGEIVQNWCQNTFGNLHLNYWEADTLFHPHSEISFMNGVLLSEYLQRGFSIVEDQVPPGAHLISSLSRAKDDTYLGKRCIVLERHLDTEGIDGAGRSVKRVWICPEANYLPLKTEDASVYGDREVIVEKAQVEELMEVEPGIYFPKKIGRYGYDYDAKSGTVSGTTRAVWEFQSVKFRPNYPVSRFREVSFKEGSLIYVLKDGRIVTEFIVGPDFVNMSLDDRLAACEARTNPASQPTSDQAQATPLPSKTAAVHDTTSEPPSGFRKSILLGAAIAACVAAAALLLWRRRTMNDS